MFYFNENSVLVGNYKVKHCRCLMVLQARSIDPYVMTYMDEYAMLLKVKSDSSKLNKLVHDLLITDPTRPEVFVALSVLWERKDERGALSYAEKVGLLVWSEVINIIFNILEHM